jgi:hypothetical protein
MNDLVPADRRIDRPALQRIIQRAAELQTADRDVGESLTEEELLLLGEEVGILPVHLRRALQEERTRALVASDRGVFNRLVGPRFVAAERVIAGTTDGIEAALKHWMTEGELLQIKRRFPDRMSWERKEGAWASLRRSFGAGGRKYVLSRAREVVTRVVDMEGRKCLVQLVADLANTRNEHLVGSGATIGAGALTTGVALVLGVMTPIAVIPALLSAPIAVAIVRSRRKQTEDFQVALEQILDRLQHGDPEPQPAKRITGAGVVDRIAEEIRKNL